MTSIRKMCVCAIGIVTTLVFWGCTPPGGQEDVTGSVPLEVSINAVMVGLVDHASHSIWNAAVPESAPKTDKDWEEVEHHAIQIASAGAVIAMAGTGQPDADWVKNPQWQEHAKQLADTGVAAWEAAKSKDMKALSDVGDRLVMVCESCHDDYKGDMPTEGITHPH